MTTLFHFLIAVNPVIFFIKTFCQSFLTVPTWSQLLIAFNPVIFFRKRLLVKFFVCNDFVSSFDGFLFSDIHKKTFFQSFLTGTTLSRLSIAFNPVIFFRKIFSVNDSLTAVSHLLVVLNPPIFFRKRRSDDFVSPFDCLKSSDLLQKNTFSQVFLSASCLHFVSSFDRFLSSDLRQKNDFLSRLLACDNFLSLLDHLKSSDLLQKKNFC